MQFSLIKKFTFLSLLAFIITGSAIVFTVSNHLKTDKLVELEEITLLTLDTLLKPKLTPNDFLTPPLMESKVLLLNESLNDIMRSTDIFGIRIWNTDSKVIFLNNISAHYEADFEFNQALKGNIKAKIITLDKNLHPGVVNNEVIQIFAPFILDNQIVGVYEVLTPYQEIKEHISALNWTIIAITFLGLLILYLFLMKVIHNASYTLVSQNESLAKQTHDLQQAYTLLDSSYKNTIMALSNAVDARDKYTAGHSQRVSNISLKIGQLMGLNEDRINLLESAALFHDIGKIGIPDEILHKPDKLTDSEFELIKLHPAMGFAILKDICFLEGTLPIILHHHEKYNGHGYPSRLEKDQIPLESRIIAIADTYDAMTSDRPYRKGLNHNNAIQEIQRSVGTQFDGEIVDAFLQIDFSDI